MIDVTAHTPVSTAPPSARPLPARGIVRPGGTEPMGVAAITTVCMGDLLHELREFLPAARVAFPGVPIVVYTDREVEALEIAADLHVGNITVRPTHDVSMAVSLDGVARHSDYWQPMPIYWKLRALQECVAELPAASRGGVLLADCDLTFRLGFERPFRGDVALSSFFWGARDIDLADGRKLQHRDGEYNAGMIVSRSRAFCDWWMDAYLAGLGGFYEQGCLDLVPGRFTTDYISPLHNWGKWRFAAPYDAVRSYHQHIGERSNRHDVGSLKLAAQRTAAEARATLAANPDLRS